MGLPPNRSTSSDGDRLSCLGSPNMVTRSPFPITASWPSLDRAAIRANCPVACESVDESIDESIEIRPPGDLQTGPRTHTCVGVGDRRVGGARSTVLGEMSGNEANHRASVLRGHEDHLVGIKVLVPRRGTTSQSAGRLTHNCTPWNRPPFATICSVGISECTMPAPAVIHWVAPSVMRPPPPFESRCSSSPSIM